MCVWQSELDQLLLALPLLRLLALLQLVLNLLAQQAMSVVPRTMLVDASLKGEDLVQG